MDDESSSGVNLTTANHAIFVHPLLAIGQQQYNAYETQVRYKKSLKCLEMAMKFGPDHWIISNIFILFD